MTPAPTLALRSVSSGYGEALVIRQVGFALQPGEIFALLGKNGMGKSTLLKTIMGFLPLSSGTISVFGEEVGGTPPHRMARRGVVYSPQEQSLFQDLSVGDNLRLGLRRDAGFSAEL